MVLETWIRETEKLFEVVRVPANRKVLLAAHYLKSEADDWWMIRKGELEATPGFSWEDF